MNSDVLCVDDSGELNCRGTDATVTAVSRALCPADTNPRVHSVQRKTGHGRAARYLEWRLL